MSHSLPQWALDAMAEAGVSTEGWIYVDYRQDGGMDGVALNHPQVPLLRVYSDGAVHSRGGLCKPSTMAESFTVVKMALQTVALEGQPCAELRAENERLNRAIDEAIRELDLSIGWARESDAQNPDAAYIFMGGDAWFSVMDAEVLASEIRKRQALSTTEQETQETQENEPK